MFSKKVFWKICGKSETHFCGRGILFSSNYFYLNNSNFSGYFPATVTLQEAPWTYVYIRERGTERIQNPNKHLRWYFLRQKLLVESRWLFSQNGSITDFREVSKCTSKDTQEKLRICGAKFHLAKNWFLDIWQGSAYAFEYYYFTKDLNRQS